MSGIRNPTLILLHNYYLVWILRKMYQSWDNCLDWFVCFGKFSIIIIQSIKWCRLSIRVRAYPCENVLKKLKFQKFSKNVLIRYLLPAILPYITFAYKTAITPRPIFAIKSVSCISWMKSPFPNVRIWLFFVGTANRC